MRGAFLGRASYRSEKPVRESGQRRTDVAEMDHKDSALRLEVTDCPLEIAEVLSSLQPAACAELHPQHRAARSGEGSLVVLAAVD